MYSDFSEGGTQYKSQYWDVLMPQAWVAKSASWYINDPNTIKKILYDWVDFSRFEPIIREKIR